MQLALSRNEYQQIPATWLMANQPHFFSQSLGNLANLKIRCKVLLVGYNFQIPDQDFIVSISPNRIEMQNQPKGDFPQIKFIANLDSPSVDIGVKASNPNSIESQILYTRLFFAIREAKSIVLSLNNKPLEINVEQGFKTSLETVKYQAKFLRKLSFLESFFNTKFHLPNLISKDDIRILEVIYFGLTKGEFSVPMGDFVTVPNFPIEKDTLTKSPFSQQGEFKYTIDSEEIPLFGKYLSVGKITISVRKASVANPRIIRNVRVGEVVPNLKLNIFDFQVHHCFERYANSEKLLRNNQKLQQFKNSLSKRESEFLVNLLDEPLSEIDNKSAHKIVTGWLQFYDFPDRYSVGEPILEGENWRIPILLTYPKEKSIWLEDAFVNSKTGVLEIKSSVEKLRNKGKKKAREVVSAV